MLRLISTEPGALLLALPTVALGPRFGIAISRAYGVIAHKLTQSVVNYIVAIIQCVLSEQHSHFYVEALFEYSAPTRLLQTACTSRLRSVHSCIQWTTITHEMQQLDVDRVISFE